MTLPYTGAAKRGILIVALIVASSTELLAQGTSPWLQAIDVLQTAFTGPIARGLSLIADDPANLYPDFASGGRDDRPGLDSCVRALRKGVCPVPSAMSRTLLPSANPTAT